MGELGRLVSPHQRLTLVRGNSLLTAQEKRYLYYKRHVMEGERTQFNITDLNKPHGQSDSVLPWPEVVTLCISIPPCFGMPCWKPCSRDPTT